MIYRLLIAFRIAFRGDVTMQDGRPVIFKLKSFKNMNYEQSWPGSSPISKAAPTGVNVHEKLGGR